MKKLICVYDSPLGKIFIESDGEFLNGLWFEYSFDEKKLEKSLKDFEIQQIDIKSAASVPVIKETCGWLDIYFAGKILLLLQSSRLKILRLLEVRLSRKCAKFLTEKPQPTAILQKKSPCRTESQKCRRRLLAARSDGIQSA